MGNYLIFRLAMPHFRVGIYVLLTRLPLERTILLAQNVTFPHDLHALSTPPAFILDQDQILKKVLLR